MEQVSFNYHLSRWRKSLSESSDKCVICHNSARGNKHFTLKCPVLKKLGMRLEKRSAADQGPDLAARVASDSSCNPAATPSPASAPVPDSGSSSLAGARMACTEAESYNSGEKFDYEGKYEGSFSAGATKSSTKSSLYLPASPLCSHSSSELSSDVPHLRPRLLLPRVPLMWLATPKASLPFVFRQMSLFYSKIPSRILSSNLLMPTSTHEHSGR